MTAVFKIEFLGHKLTESIVADLHLWTTAITYDQKQNISEQNWVQKILSNHEIKIKAKQFTEDEGCSCGRNLRPTQTDTFFLSSTWT